MPPRSQTPQSLHTRLTNAIKPSEPPPPIRTASESEVIPTRLSSPNASSIGAAHNAVDPAKNTAVDTPEDSKSKLQHLVDEKDSSANKLYALGEKIDFHERALKKWQDKMNTAFEAHRKINKKGKNRAEEFKKSREIYAPIMHLSGITIRNLFH
jgi:hypothetical protein